MKEIKLTKNMVALVDDADFELLSQWKWYVSCGYAARWFNGRNLYMHKVLVSGSEVDHINNNRLDNRRENLRAVTHAQNIRNSRVYKNNKTGHKGISFYRNGFRATIGIGGKAVWLGDYQVLADAVSAYSSAYKELQ